jgi:sulfur-carrier protein
VSTVRIPPILRASAHGEKQVEVEGSTVAEVLSSLVRRYPSLAPHLMSGDGGLNRFVNVYVEGQDVRYLEELATPVRPTDTVIILPAMAGG